MSLLPIESFGYAGNVSIDHPQATDLALDDRVTKAFATSARYVDVAGRYGEWTTHRPYVLLERAPGLGKTAFMTAIFRALQAPKVQRLGYLQIGESRFEITSDDSGHMSLQPASGGRRVRGIARHLLRTSADDGGIVFRRVSAAERYAGLDDVNPLRLTRGNVDGWAGRLVQRAANRLDRQVRRSSQPVTSASLWRRLIRAAISILRQLLGLQRRRCADTPEAVTHSHKIDQYRTRGPNRARTTLSFMVLRERVPV